MRQFRDSRPDVQGALDVERRGAPPRSPGAAPADHGRPPTWSEQAPSILAPRLRAANDALLRLEGKVELARTLLSTVAIRGPLTRFAVERASARLERARITAGLARVLLRKEEAWVGLASRAAMARREVTELRPLLYQVHEVLARLARKSTAIRPTPGEIGDIDRAAQAAREALSVLQALAEVLIDLAGRPACALSAGDLRALGLAFAGGTLAPQMRWNEESVDELARRRVEGRRSRGVLPAVGPGVPSVGDVLLALKASGIELGQVDPGQLRPAARFVSAAGAAGRPERMARVVDAFHALARCPRSVWSRSKMASHLAGMARVPTRTILSLSDHEVFERYQEVVRALNTGPGPAYTRIGPYHLTFEADENGHLVRASRLRHGVLFRAAGALGHGGPLTLTTLRHFKATEPLGRLLAGSLDTGEALGRSAFARLATAGVALLRSASARKGTKAPPLPARLGRASRELEDAAVMGAAVVSYHAAERATADARRALASALASSDPSAVARAKRLLEAAEEAKGRALQECATGLLHGEPQMVAGEGTGAPFGPVPPLRGLDRTEQPVPTVRPATTGASLRGLAGELRQTRRLVERVMGTASDLQDLSGRPDVPKDLRQAAGASAVAVEEAIRAFRRGVGTSDDEGGTQAARVAFEQRVMGIVADHQKIHLALAARSPETDRPRSAPPAARSASRSAPPRRS